MVLFTCFHYSIVSYHIMNIAYSLSSYTLVSFALWKIFFIHNKFVFQMHLLFNSDQAIFNVQYSFWGLEKAACSALQVTRFLRVHRTSRMKKWKQRTAMHVALMVKYGALHLSITDSEWKLPPCDPCSVTHMKCVGDLHLAPGRYFYLVEANTKVSAPVRNFKKAADNCSATAIVIFWSV